MVAGWTTDKIKFLLIYLLCFCCVHIFNHPCNNLRVYSLRVLHHCQTQHYHICLVSGVDLYRLLGWIVSERSSRFRAHLKGTAGMSCSSLEARLKWNVHLSCMWYLWFEIFVRQVTLLHSVLIPVISKAFTGLLATSGLSVTGVSFSSLRACWKWNIQFLFVWLAIWEVFVRLM